MTGHLTAGTPSLYQRVNDILDTDLEHVWALSKRLPGRLLSIRWRHALRPRNLFAWDDHDDAVSSNPSRRHSSTAWLDGARGVSALQVYIFHFAVSGYAVAGRTYGSTPEDDHWHQHPLVRPVWNAGAASVCNFFIISGYALTTNSFRLMREGRQDEVYRGLGSSVLRRWFRLWLPVIAVAAPMVFAFQYWPYVGLYHPGRKDSLREEIANFLVRLDEMVQPWPFMNKNGVGWAFEYVNQAWTIPLEFHCSMVCYLVVMLVSRLPLFRHRVFVMGFLAFYAMHHAIFWTSLFLIGMLLADWNLEQQQKQMNGSLQPPWQPNGDTTNVPKPSNLSRRFSLSSILNLTIFFIGYYLSGMPMQNPQESPYIPKPGYETLYALQPPRWLFDIDFELRWYQSLSAVCLVYSTSQSPFLKGLFETRPCQWLGKLSFALYLVHVQVMGMVQGPFRAGFQYLVGERGLVMFVVEFLVVGALTFAGAAGVWRCVDAPTVRFARGLDEWLTGRRRGVVTNTALQNV